MFLSSAEVQELTEYPFHPRLKATMANGLKDGSYLALEIDRRAHVFVVADDRARFPGLAEKLARLKVVDFNVPTPLKN